MPLDRASFRLQNTIIPHNDHYWLCIFNSDEQECLLRSYKSALAEATHFLVAVMTGKCYLQSPISQRPEVRRSQIRTVQWIGPSSQLCNVLGAHQTLSCGLALEIKASSCHCRGVAVRVDGSLVVVCHFAWMNWLRRSLFCEPTAVQGFTVLTPRCLVYVQQASMNIFSA
jgi:hypothetical protein